MPFHNLADPTRKLRRALGMKTILGQDRPNQPFPELPDDIRKFRPVPGKASEPKPPHGYRLAPVPDSVEPDPALPEPPENIVKPGQPSHDPVIPPGLIDVLPGGKLPPQFGKTPSIRQPDLPEIPGEPVNQTPVTPLPNPDPGSDILSQIDDLQRLKEILDRLREPNLQSPNDDGLVDELVESPIAEVNDYSDRSLADLISEGEQSLQDDDLNLELTLEHPKSALKTGNSKIANSDDEQDQSESNNPEDELDVAGRGGRRMMPPRRPGLSPTPPLKRAPKNPPTLDNSYPRTSKFRDGYQEWWQNSGRKLVNARTSGKKILSKDSYIWRNSPHHRKLDGYPTRTNGQTGKHKRYYQWDNRHGEIEVYNHNGKHLGARDPLTGHWVKPKSPGRTIPVRRSSIDDPNNGTA